MIGHDTSVAGVQPALCERLFFVATTAGQQQATSLECDGEAKCRAVWAAVALSRRKHSGRSRMAVAFCTLVVLFCRSGSADRRLGRERMCTRDQDRPLVGLVVQAGIHICVRA